MIIIIVQIRQIAISLSATQPGHWAVWTGNAPGISWRSLWYSS